MAGWVGLPTAHRLVGNAEFVRNVLLSIAGTSSQGGQELSYRLFFHKMPPIDSILTSGKRFHNNAYGKFVAESQNFI